MPVTIESRLRQIQVFNLAHTSFCKEACACTDIVVMGVHEDPRTGQRARRALPRKVAASLTLLARERREGLPDVVLRVPEVAAAIARGHVRVIEQTAERPPQPAPPAPPAAPRPAVGPPAPGDAAAAPPKTPAPEPARKEG